MRFYLTLLGLFTASSLSAQATLPSSLHVTVYTTKAYKIQQAELANKVYWIDAVDNLENAFALQLSKQPETAEKQFKAFFNSSAGMKFQQELKEAYIGVAEAWKTGVMKVPAIVFDDGQPPKVIYGETNVAKALQRYRALNKGG